MEITKRYPTEELDVIWKPKLCIHAAECVKRLPNVYDPKAKPWVTPENASTEELIDQINACPSGALTFELKGGRKMKEEKVSEVKVQVTANGPVLVHGDIHITYPDGSEEKKEKMTALCRCGASGNKPFCDGQHNKIGFKAE